MNKFKTIKQILLICFIFLIKFSVAQTPIIIRPSNNNTIKIPKETPPAQRQANKPDAPISFDVLNKDVLNYFANSFSLLQFSNYNAGGKEFASYWEFNKTTTNEISTEYPKTKNWKKTVTWRKIPVGTAFGLWQISTQPFSLINDPNFTGVIRTGEIPTNGIDSVYFEINYTDDENMERRDKLPGLKIKNKPIPIQVIKTPVQNNDINKIESNNTIANNEVKINTRASGNSNSNSTINPITDLPLSKFKLFGDGTRKFYIRLIPLDVNKKPLEKISNEVVLIEKNQKPWIPAAPQNYLANDYTITDVKYVPVHFPEGEFLDCTVITDYNFPAPSNPPSQSSAFGLKDNDIFALQSDKFNDYFRAAFPIGTTLCPTPPKEKAWYEKAFNGVTGFTKETINGASKFYNDVVSYAQDKFVELNCNSGTLGKVINPASNLQEAAGPEVCGAIASTVFKGGMAAVGIPPSLPNVDDLVSMAEGQIVDLACDNLEGYTGVPVPEFVREEIRKEFHDKLVKQSKAGIVNNGFFKVKPHPRGQFQTAYLEIEVTRTGSSYKDRGNVSFSVNDNTTRTIETGQKEKKELSINLFESTSTQVPFLANVGDKTKVYIILKPQESYVHYDNNTKAISRISTSPQLGWYNPPTPTYQGYTNTTGWSMMYGKGSITKFSFGLKIAAGQWPSFFNK